jgi:hypothetical protein
VVIASVTPMFDCPAASPTAVHEPGAGQDTPNNSELTVPAGTGTGCSRHLVPFHVLAKPAGGVKSLADSTPTAVQASAREVMMDAALPLAVAVGSVHPVAHGAVDRAPAHFRPAR